MSTQESPQQQVAAPSPLLVILLSAMAGGMGWGIRGQYGHETGAMIAGALVGLVLTFFFCPLASSLFTARAVALMTVAIGFGGSMTYGQTVGLTHDAPLIGNSDALTWGLVGLFIKGGIWIAFAGAFLGIGLSRVQYKSSEIATLLVAMVFLLFLGLSLINSPFDPANKDLPNVYFSDQWFWEPDAELTPRPERWGGLLFALVGVILYVSLIKRDQLAQMLAVFGFLAGGFGFSIGQSVQAYHAWHPEVFESGLFAEGALAQIVSNFNWWNMMETTFGAVFGAILAFGLWLNRGLIKTDADEEPVEMSSGNEWLLIVVHVAAIIAWNFMSYRALDQFADHAITMGLIPIIGIVSGRFWPYLLSLPIVILPIAGKTIRQLVYNEPQTEALLARLGKAIEWIPNVGAQWSRSLVETIGASPQYLKALGWIAYGAIPVGLALIVALLLFRQGQRGQSGRSFARWALLFSAWTYFCLNFAFFEFSWPWAPLDQWTSRTPNASLFAISLLGITLTTLFYGYRLKPLATPAAATAFEPAPEPESAPEPAADQGQDPERRVD